MPPGPATTVRRGHRHQGLVRRFGHHRRPSTASTSTSAEGEIYGFLGPNGAGKSTVVRMLCTLLRPSAGTAMVAGHDVVDEPSEVGSGSAWPSRRPPSTTGRPGVSCSRSRAGSTGSIGARSGRRVGDVLDLVDIGGAIDRRIGTYSGGMKRRLDLAAALIHNPEVLFLDEPTTGLDPTSRASVWSEVRRLNAELGMTIFLTTQYLEEADALADRVGIIAGGRLVAEGPPDAAQASRRAGRDRGRGRRATTPSPWPGSDATGRRRRRVRRRADRITVSTSDGPAALSPVALALGTTGLEVRSLTLRTPTLDDVFLELTGSHIESRSGR